MADFPGALLVLADEQEIVRVGLRAALSGLPELQIARETADAASTLEASQQLRVGLFLIDPGRNLGGPRLIREIKSYRADTKVLVFTSKRSHQDVISVLQAGADGYLLKEASISELLFAVRSVLQGDTYLSPAIAGLVVGNRLDDALSAGINRADAVLSERERQVLRLVALGRTTKEIAADLYISPRTVEKHRAHLMQKLKLKSIAAVLAFAMENGLLDEASAGASIR
jgi:two-component system response regulator NreC